MGVFILRVGSDWPMFLGSGQAVAPWWRVGWGTAQRGSVLKN